MEWLKNTLDSIVAWATSTGLKLLIALVLMFVSFKLINWVAKKIIKNGEKKHLDKTILKTISHLVSIGGKVIVTVCLVGYVGIDTSAITALIASFGVCIGLAVNGAVSNIAGGVLILITRPFKVDDFIEAQGISGTVADIHLINTKIVTGDNKVIYIPNGSLSNGNIINYSEKEIRRVDFNFSISYNADFDQARSVVLDILNSHELVLDDPAPFVRMSKHAASSIDIVARAWVRSGDYWTVNFDVLEKVKAEFDKNHIEIPFDQIDVHVKND
ncbi:MAG: mechanosensitive ion channel [Clostridia bacterium]|nr:mechanosensitive ion channel [Clostridia bacterium]